MIGNIDWLGRIIGAVPDGDVSWNAKVAKALIREGLAVVIIEPNGKKAVCTLNSRDKKKADQEAQDKAREAGSPNWDKVRHDCGIKHAITDEKMLMRTRIRTLLSQGANLAVAPGMSTRRVIIVDVDTAEEKRAFLEDWSTGEDDGKGYAYEALDFPLTVTSPGTMNTTVDQHPVWVHKNGGHYWFDLPEDIELPESPGKLTWCRCHGVSQPKGGCRNAWTAYYGSGYVLVPPSFRPEGAYRLTGGLHVAGAWLTDLIREARTSTRAENGSGALSALDLADDPIDVWSAEHSWYEILTGDGFTPFEHDSCGCPTFTRPVMTGETVPAHGKSVTAHEFGCAKYDTSKGHGPLRIWTDALGSGTMSKLSYMARFHHEGDTGAAMRELGISAESGDGDELFSLGKIPKGGAPSENGAARDQASDEDSEDRFAPINWDDLFSEDPTKADHLPAQLLERGQQIALIGDGKSGKSLLIAEWCIKAIQGASFLTDNQTEPIVILYLDAENSKRDLIMRVKSLGGTADMLRGTLIYLSFPPFKPLDSDDGARQVLELVVKYTPDVVILDTVSRFIKGKENDSDTWLALYRLLHRRLKAHDIACIRLDHFGKDAEKGGRGSSAKSHDVDHVWELVNEEDDARQKGNATEVTTLLKLKRTHTRTGLGADFLRIKRTGLKTDDEWLPGETKHEMADAFDGGFGDIAEPVQRPVRIMAQVAELLGRIDNGMPLRQIRSIVGGNKDVVDYAIECLVSEGYVSRETIGRANVHKLLKPFPDEAL